eukprot:4114108-Amphidinium_carterae.1
MALWLACKEMQHPRLSLKYHAASMCSQCQVGKGNCWVTHFLSISLTCVAKFQVSRRRSCAMHSACMIKTSFKFK